MIKWGFKLRKKLHKTAQSITEIPHSQLMVVLTNTCLSNLLYKAIRVRGCMNN